MNENKALEFLFYLKGKCQKFTETQTNIQIYKQTRKKRLAKLSSLGYKPKEQKVNSIWDSISNFKSYILKMLRYWRLNLNQPI